MTTPPEDIRAVAADAVAEAHCCLICYEEGPDENGDPVHNELCSCRGESGYFHSACLVEAAKAKTNSRGDLYEIWLECSTCKQRWDSSILALMGNECAKFVSEKYSQDKYRKLAALLTKHAAISYSTSSSVEDKELVSNEVLTAIKEDEEDESACSRRMRLIHLATFEASYDLGCVAYDRKEPELAIEHFTKALEANGALGYGDDDIEALSIQLMVVKSQGLLPGADIVASDKNILQLLRVLFQKSSDDKGENSRLSLVSGYELAKELHHQNKLIEAKELLERLHPKSYRVLGSHHSLTHKCEHVMDSISRDNV